MNKVTKKWSLSINPAEKRIYIVCPQGVCRSYNEYKSPKYVEGLYSEMEETIDFANQLTLK